MPILYGKEHWKTVFGTRLVICKNIEETGVKRTIIVSARHFPQYVREILFFFLFELHDIRDPSFIGADDDFERP